MRAVVALIGWFRFLFFFFFQAEDGIRDRNVTGVQTCALGCPRDRLQLRAGHPRRGPTARVRALLSRRKVARPCERRCWDRSGDREDARRARRRTRRRRVGARRYSLLVQPSCRGVSAEAVARSRCPSEASQPPLYPASGDTRTPSAKSQSGYVNSVGSEMTSMPRHAADESVPWRSGARPAIRAAT